MAIKVRYSAPLFKRHQNRRQGSYLFVVGKAQLICAVKVEHFKILKSNKADDNITCALILILVNGSEVTPSLRACSALNANGTVWTSKCGRFLHIVLPSDDLTQEYFF